MNPTFLSTPLPPQKTKGFVFLVLVFVGICLYFVLQLQPLERQIQRTGPFEGKSYQIVIGIGPFSAPVTHKIIPFKQRYLSCSGLQCMESRCYAIGWALLRYANHAYHNQGPSKHPKSYTIEGALFHLYSCRSVVPTLDS